MEILLTGGNGLIGHHLITALQERGDHLRVLVLPAEDTTWLEERGITVFRGDIRNPDVLAAPMRGVEGVFHLAAMMGAWRSMADYAAVNVWGTEHVCRAALAAGVRRLVHVSSAMVYDMTRGQPVDEDTPLAPLDEPYCQTKAQGDALVRQLAHTEHLPAVVLRPGTVFGPGDRLNFGRIADRLRKNVDVVIGPGDNAVPFVYVSDVVQGFLLALDAPAAADGQAYNIGNDEPLTQIALLRAIAEEIGAHPRLVHVPYVPLYGAAYVAERVGTLSRNHIPPFLTRHGVKLYGASNRLSIEKARRDLGYTPHVSVREGIHRTALWYLDTPSRLLAPMTVPTSAPTAPGSSDVPETHSQEGGSHAALADR